MNFTLPKNQPPSRTHKKKELYKLLVARSDITASFNACNIMLEEVDGMSHPLYYPIYSAIVVCYARPFTVNKPHGSLSKKWRKFEDKIFNYTHFELLKSRNELIAYSDMNIRIASIVPQNVEINKNATNPIISPYISAQISTYYYHKPFFEDSISLFNYQGLRINGAIDDLIEDLYGGMELPRAVFPIKIDDGL